MQIQLSSIEYSFDLGDSVLKCWYIREKRNEIYVPYVLTLCTYFVSLLHTLILHTYS